MNEIIVPETGVPLVFPDPRAEAFARAEEFRRLSPEARLREITAMMAWGLKMVHTSARRAATEAMWQGQEDLWRERQRKVFDEHGPADLAERS